ncbi:MAG: hypothetical protein PHU06_06290 [Gallionella sp.]|nr:hypothetical protein [Gallionella sp.]MDD4958425.1 hypothetical protein [Gallionella sp.]
MDIRLLLSTWDNLNTHIFKLTEDELTTLMEAEMAGKKRKMFVLRIHSRLNRLRADRERDSLIIKLAS